MVWVPSLGPKEQWENIGSSQQLNASLQLAYPDTSFGTWGSQSTEETKQTIQWWIMRSGDPVPSHLSESPSSSTRIRLVLERDCRLHWKRFVHARTLALFSRPNIFYKQMVNCSGIRRLKHLRILILNLQYLSLIAGSRSEILVLQNSIAKTIKHAEVSWPQWDCDYFDATWGLVWGTAPSWRAHGRSFFKVRVLMPHCKRLMLINCLPPSYNKPF